ncbi:unnamed protein product [Aphanomyces euteiches]
MTAATIVFDAFFADLTKIRRHLHENPELSFQDFKTQAFVRDYLIHQAHIPADQITDCARTGLTNFPAWSDDPSPPTQTKLHCIAFRGDMDALPMTERNPHLQHQSKVAHMCGHDGHTANLMGFASLAQQRCHVLPRHLTIRLLFQPAEEGHFGAPAMIKEGCLDGVDQVYGYHNASYPLGNIHVKSGPIMAHGGLFTITISGPGGHGIPAGQFISSIQTIASRSISPHDSAIISICQIHGGEVMPSSVKLSGTTVRDFSPAVEATVKQRMTTIVEQTCAAFE